MNLQTLKPRAYWQPELGCWLVTHPMTERWLVSARPHDTALALLRKHVLPRQVELIGEKG